MSQVDTGRVRQKRRTRQALLQAARELLRTGAQPTIQDVADHASISRATAYRYYSNTETLLQEAVLDGIAQHIGSLQIAGSARSDATLEARLEAVVGDVVDMVLENEALFRAYLRTVAAGEDGKARGGRRIGWLSDALGKDRARLPQAIADRLVFALCLLTGIETVVVAKDICRLTDRQIRDYCRWTARTLLKGALLDLREA